MAKPHTLTPVLSNPHTNMRVRVFVVKADFSMLFLTHTQNACTEEEIKRLISEKVRKLVILFLIP